MTELQPLLSQHDDEFELALLRSADRDEPSERGKLRVAAALGLSVAAAASSLATVSAAAGVSAAASVTGASGAGANAGLSAILKSLAIGTATGVATLGSLHYADMLPAAFQPPAPVVTPAAPVVVSTPPAPVSLKSRSEPPAQVATSRAATAAPRAERSPRAVQAALAAPGPAKSDAAPMPEVEPKAEAPRATSIAGEIAEIDRIRGALRGGQPAQALLALERYFQSSPTRVLETEASLLQIDALVALGERERASALAREFVTRQPTSRYAQRLRQLADQ